MKKKLGAIQFKSLLLKELRELAAARALWVMLLVLCPFVGFSFIEATFLYAHAGQSVLGDEILLGLLTPLEGIVVPTFSALYMTETFLFPFIAIRILGVEKQFGSLKFLLQICPDFIAPIFVKAFVLMGAFCLSLIPAIVALAVWHQMGGYLHMPEVGILFLGHFLFALLIISISFFAVSITDSPQTAAIVTLAFTITSWVLEFAGQNQSTLASVSWLSMTAHLRLFESALFSLQTTLGFLIAAMFFFGLSAVYIKSSYSNEEKFKKTLLIIIGTALAGLLASQTFYFKDFSENRANSFNPNNEAELRKVTKPLKINIHLNPDDSLAVDFERNFLSKLRRVVKDVSITYTVPKEKAENEPGDPSFGLITYDYNDVRFSSHDVGAIRALEVLHMMTGTNLTGEVASPYPGHPINIDASNYRILFYMIMPGLVLLGWFYASRSLRMPKKKVVNDSQ